MRKMNVILLGVGAVVVLGAAGGWFACGGWKAIARTYTDEASSASQITEIRVSGGTVAVEIRPTLASGVQIHRTVRFLNPLQGRPAATHRIEGGVLYLGDDGTALSAVEYTVAVPAGVRVSADISTGSIDADGVSDVEANVSTGSITVTDTSGTVTARVGTGSITGRSLHSAVTASTGTGAISLELEAAANVEARAGTGSVDVTVPNGGYRVDATSGMGEVKVGVPNDSASPFRLSLRSNLGRVSVSAGH